MSLIYSMPVTTLKNGLVVGNFSSPHDFNFNTGENILHFGKSTRSCRIIISSWKIIRKIHFMRLR